VAEDIESKIRRLRELGKVTPEVEPTKPVGTPRKPPKRAKPTGIRARERRKRIIIGATVLVVIILIVSIGAWAYLQSQAGKALQEAKTSKEQEITAYYNTYVKKYSKNAYAKEVLLKTKNELLAKVKAAKNTEEVRAINVKEAFRNALLQIQRYEYSLELNQTKQKVLAKIERDFVPLLSRPLPNNVREEAMRDLKMLKEKIKQAKTIEDVKSVDDTPYLLKLWQDYLSYQIDNVKTPKVVLEWKEGEKIRREIYTKTAAKMVIQAATNYTSLMTYKVMPVQYVMIGILLSGDRIANGAILKPGSQVIIYSSKNSSSLANDVTVEYVLLPTTSGQISLSESQSSYSTGSSVYSESSSGSLVVTESSSSTVTASNSTKASYTYSVNLIQVLKALAANKLKDPSAVEAQLEGYGWRLLNYEKNTGIMVVEPNVKVMLIVKLPAIFVPDLLANQNTLYVATVVS